MSYAYDAGYNAGAEFGPHTADEARDYLTKAGERPTASAVRDFVRGSIDGHRAETRYKAVPPYGCDETAHYRCEG